MIAKLHAGTYEYHAYIIFHTISHSLLCGAVSLQMMLSQFGESKYCSPEQPHLFHCLTGCAPNVTVWIKHFWKNTPSSGTTLWIFDHFAPEVHRKSNVFKSDMNNEKLSVNLKCFTPCLPCSDDRWQQQMNLSLPAWPVFLRLKHHRKYALIGHGHTSAEFELRSEALLGAGWALSRGWEEFFFFFLHLPRPPLRELHWMILDLE